MKSIILSFKPGVFTSLLTREKKFEYRSRIPKGELEAYLYLSNPVKMIVGKLILGDRMLISGLLDDGDKDVRDNLEKHMLEGARFCLPIISVSLFKKPISLAEAKEFSPNFYAPQSFSYIRNYPELSGELEQRILDTYDVNPNHSLDKLGLFSSEIIKKFPRQIALPDYLKQYKVFE